MVSCSPRLVAGASVSTQTVASQHSLDGPKRGTTTKRRLFVGWTAIVLLRSCGGLAERAAAPAPTPADAALFTRDGAHLLQQSGSDLDADGKLE